MSRGQNTIKRSEISTTPALLKYSASYDSASFTSRGITVNRGINSSYSTSGVQFLNYALVKQLYYQEYLTGSLLSSASFWDSSIQSTAASGTFDQDNRYFPTESNAEITVIGIPRTVFGEQIARKSLIISSSVYKLIDDGNGNVIDVFVTGSQSSSNAAYGRDGVKLYSPGYNTDGTGTNLVWKTSDAGGTYAGTFWANPVTANQTGRLNYTGIWSAKDLTFFGSGYLSFNINIPSNGTYYFGIGCDNYASLYVDNNLILSQAVPDAGSFGANYEYWHIYPINLTSGIHSVKLVGNNIGIPSIFNPASLGIEIYNNTEVQISSSITAEPMGSSIPAGLNVLYSSKDYKTSGIFAENTHVGNVLYSQGVIVVSNLDYANAMIPTTTTTTSTTSTTTTVAPTTTTTTTSTTSTTTTVAPTTTTSTTSTTTTAAPTTSTTTTTTTAAPTTTTTTSTTTTTTTEAPTTTTTTTTSTTTTTTTLAGQLIAVYETGYSNQTWEVRFSADSSPGTSQDVAVNSLTNPFPITKAVSSGGPLGITGPNTVSTSIRKTTNSGNLQGNLIVTLYINNVAQIPNYTKNTPFNFSSFTTTHTGYSINPGDSIKIQISEA